VDGWVGGAGGSFVLWVHGVVWVRVLLLCWSRIATTPFPSCLSHLSSCEERAP
jgi:hypothetical protein